MIPSITMLLMCTPFSLPMASYLNWLIFIYDHLWESFPFMRIFWIFPSYENLFESLLIYDHLWKCWVRIFYENLFGSLLVYDHQWESLESFLISDHLWKSFPIMSIFLNFFLFMITCKGPFFFITTFLNLFAACNTIFMKISQRMNFIV